MKTNIKDFKLTLESQNIPPVNLEKNLLTDEKAENYRTAFQNYIPKIKGFKTESGRFKVGDIIKFNSGYNNDIRYTSEILGFDEDDDIYVLCDCYWSPIRDEQRRNIEII